MMFQTSSIKHKLESIILVTAASVLLLSLMLFMMVELNAARDETSTRLQALATVLGANSRAALVFRDHEAAREILTTLSSQGDVLWAAITHPDQMIFADYSIDGFNRAKSQQKDSVMPFLSSSIKISEAIEFDGKTIGHLHIIGDMSRAHAVLMQQAYLGVGIFILSMLVAMLLSSRLQRVISEPVRRLLDTMHTVAVKRDFSCRAERLGDDELGTLVDGFNTMLDQLETYDKELNAYHQNLEQLVSERTQELESATQQAEAANRAKSLFLASISHEIRTPLNGVLGMVQVIHNTRLTEEQKHYIDTLDSATKSLLMLIDDLLDLSKIESGKLALDIEPFETGRWLTDIQNLTEPFFENGKLIFYTEIDETLPAYLLGDASRIQQIVVNLVSNAAKYTPEGEVRLKIGGHPVSDSAFNLHISVEDTGVGIAADKLDYIFNAFHQIDPSNNTGKGVGLGLAICKRLADIMNGQIHVSSQQGRGSCFTLDLALPVPDTAPESVHDMECPVLSPLSILLVDDDDINRMAARTLLQQRGHDITEAQDGQMAIDLVSSRSFDVILMDIHMPVMDGITATRAIRDSKQHWRQIPVIGLTASVMSDQRDQYLEAGMNAVVEKPIIIEKLLKTIQQLLEQGELNSDQATTECR